MSLVTPKKGYKSVPWLFGKEIEIPEEWGSSKLKEVVILSQGLQVPEENQSSKKLDGYERFLRIVDYQEEIPPRYVEISKRQAITNEKTIVMVRYGAGAGNIYTGLKGVIANNLFQIISKKDNLKNNFLYIFLKRDFIENYLRHISGTTTMPNINHGLVYNLIILLPSLPEQQKIATILSNVDNLIEATEQVITHSKKVKTGLMQKLLTRGIGHVTFKKVLWLFGKEIEIPEEWEVVKLSETGDLINGLNKEKKDYGHGCLHVNIDNIFESFSIIPEKLGRVNATQKEIDTYALQKGDICILRSSVKREGVGYPSLFENNHTSIVFSGFIIRFRPHMIWNPTYLTFLLRSVFMRNIVVSKSSSSANTNINQKSLGSIQMIIPSLPEQQKIASILSNIDSKIESQEQYKEKLERLKKSLMQKLLTGEVRV